LATSISAGLRLFLEDFRSSPIDATDAFAALCILSLCLLPSVQAAIQVSYDASRQR
jgi:hypothetical protein